MSSVRERMHRRMKGERVCIRWGSLDHDRRQGVFHLVMLGAGYSPPTRGSSMTSVEPRSATWSARACHVLGP